MTGLIAAGLAAALVTGCQSAAGGTGGGATPLSLIGLTKAADGMSDDGAAACPLPYDVAEAAKTAGLNEAAGAGPAQDDGEPVATAEGGTRVKFGEPLAENPGVLVSCTCTSARTTCRCTPSSPPSLRRSPRWQRCSGRCRVATKRRTFSVRIPAGVRSGQKIRLRELGAAVLCSDLHSRESSCVRCYSVWPSFFP